MWIYKITNIQNNKIYIGQTIRPVEQRIHRHFNDALNNIIDTHFARAIRKYGEYSFVYEIIDTAETQEELTLKEQQYIRMYHSTDSRYGYNETDAISKCGGNTYQSKTEEELEVIKEKIRQTKIGAKNPMARKIKRTNIITNEVDIFETVISCAKACGIQNGKTSITDRLNGKIKSPFKKTWIFEYYDE